ncbi:MAG: nicotinate phosphoribosyltransferase, partial [Synechococcus sp.]|nr:nicotinate phosphoribosyltransferase [Synechococcus sp.]
TEDLATIRQRTTANVRQLPDGVKRLAQPETYPVSISEDLQNLTEAIAKSL